MVGRRNCVISSCVTTAPPWPGWGKGVTDNRKKCFCVKRELLYSKLNVANAAEIACRRPSATRSPVGRGYDNGGSPKKVDAPGGNVTIQVPMTASQEEPFIRYPSQPATAPETSTAQGGAAATLAVLASPSDRRAAILAASGRPRMGSTHPILGP